jgi:hypothetical protein
MRNTKKSVQAAIEVVPALIAETIVFEQEIARLQELAKANREAIKAAMIALDITRQPTSEGHEAILIEKLTLSWNVAALKCALSRDEFEELCPRKAVGEQLRQLMEGSESERAKELRSCAKGSRRIDLELRSAAESTAKAVVA